MPSAGCRASLPFVTATIQDVLSDLRRTALDERDKGDKFERLVRSFLARLVCRDRERYAADLKKMLPRIPLVTTAADARAFADAGRALSEIHIGYESVAPYPLEGLHPDDEPVAEDRGDAAYRFYAVGDKKMRFGRVALGGGMDHRPLLHQDRQGVRHRQQPQRLVT